MRSVLTMLPHQRVKVATVAIVFIVTNLSLIFWTQSTGDSSLDVATKWTSPLRNTPWFAKEEDKKGNPPQAGTSQVSLPPEQLRERLAYAIYLSGTSAPETDNSIDADNYLIATRILIYQLLYAPSTRTKLNIPVLILATPDVDDHKLERLAKDGASIIRLDFVTEGSDWIRPANSRYEGMMSKLRCWDALSEYSRVLLIDSDTILRRNLDAIFEDPVTQLNKPLEAPKNWNGTQPFHETVVSTSYLLAGLGEVNGKNHKYPPTWDDFKNKGNFNGGFLMFHPSRDLFRHYMSILKQPNSFNSDYAEQSLLNYAHRLDGPMPWRMMNTTWNIRAPTQNDVDSGVASLHEKWWKAPKSYPEIQSWFLELRWKMYGFFEAMDMKA
ncbi:nucleotide-diphospho-sugar transferase [Bisporella sp. PMI_857]|nr:nucleotide-diphospho-sugar transferase [Bisporella sp. PMI_857]